MKPSIFDLSKLLFHCQEKRRQQLIEIERSFAEHTAAQAELALTAQRNRENFVAIVAQEEGRLTEEIEQLSRQRDSSRQRLIQDLQAGRCLLTIFVCIVVRSGYMIKK